MFEFFINDSEFEKFLHKHLWHTSIQSWLTKLRQGKMTPKQVFKKIKLLNEQIHPQAEIPLSQAIIRPTGLIDPKIILKPVKNQVDDVLEEVRKRVINGQRVLVTTLTKKFAEELDLYFKQINVKSAYIHSDVETLDRVDILADLRRGKYDVLIGINLLREGLDLPEVSLVAIFDADKEGFLRSKTSLIQIVGRAARHIDGTVIMYGDSITESMQFAIDETNRRRAIQLKYNQDNNIIPTGTSRDITAEVEKEDKGVKNKSKDSDEAYKIENYNSRQKPQRNNTRGKQVYSNFDELKSEFLENFESQNLPAKKLQTELNKAIKNKEFEKAAAISEILAKK
jgi:excinuclease ABC subunit B